MKLKDKHIGREAMLKLIKDGDKNRPKHLKECEECTALYHLLKSNSNIKTAPILKPDDSILNRLASIPILTGTGKNLLQQGGRLVYDSWNMLPAAQLRGISPGFIRRLCLQSNNIKLEIIAERHHRSWHFTARVYDIGDISMEWVLSAGGKKLTPKSFGFYQWSSNIKPHLIKLFNMERQIIFERISWV